MSALDTIVELSHEFGTDDYVRGGGGNTSVKDESTLWVKPSGTTLSGLTGEHFVALDRAKVNALYETATPADVAAREELVKNLMAAAVINAAGRPSVEAPLHNLFKARYVVHTHPALVNGMTCAKQGASACAELFPRALWVDYIDPGYTLCMDMRRRLDVYVAEHGTQPAVLMLKNHGVFVAGDSADEIREHYAHVMHTLEQVYDRQGISRELSIADTPPDSEIEEHIQALLGHDAEFIAASGLFAYPRGPISPDHLVYARAYPFDGALTADAVAAYKKQYGFPPKVVVAGEHVYGIGTSRKNADLALELAQDGALVQQLAAAFGGIAYMTDRAREFIENWEVESYRQSC